MLVLRVRSAEAAGADSASTSLTEPDSHCGGSPAAVPSVATVSRLWRCPLAVAEAWCALTTRSSGRVRQPWPGFAGPASCRAAQLMVR